jgi:D-alanine-D-alanine ligase
VTVGVLFGGPSPEHDISILTGLLALRELHRGRGEPVGVYWTKTGDFYQVPATTEAEVFLEGVPPGATGLSLRLGADGGFYAAAGRLSKDRRLPVDALIMATHGGPGEDGTIQGALDLAGIAYSGPTVAGAALGMDKWAFSTLVAGAGLPSLPRALLSADTTSLDFAGPYIVKPRFGGSSIGIDVVADLTTAKARLATNVHLARGCVIEPFRADLTDVQIAVRTYPTVELSAIEKPIRRSLEAEILDYRDKYVGGEGMVSAPRELPARLAAGQADAVVAATRRLVDVALVRGVARVDFLANDTELYVNEINTIPGSLSKHLFVDPPLAFSQLLADLAAESLERPAHRYSAAGADGVVLRGAGSIAAKLA